MEAEQTTQTAERDELLARLQEEQIIADNMEAELDFSTRRIRALEQELQVASQRVEILEEQLQEREPLRRRLFRRRARP